MIRNFFKEEGELYLNERYAKKDNSFSKKLWYDKKEENFCMLILLDLKGLFTIVY